MVDTRAQVPYYVLAWLGDNYSKTALSEGSKTAKSTSLCCLTLKALRRVALKTAQNGGDNYSNMGYERALFLCSELPRYAYTHITLTNYVG